MIIEYHTAVSMSISISNKILLEYLVIFYIAINILKWYNIKDFGGDSLAYSDANRRAVNKYNKKNYKVITVRVKKGEEIRIQQRADSLGLSVNKYILNLIDKDIEEAYD